jgi:hypothetical protein
LERGKTLSRAEQWLRNPPRGSQAAAPRRYGVELTLWMEQLRLTAEERRRELESALNLLGTLRRTRAGD